MYRWILLTGTEKNQHLKKYCWILLTGIEKDQKKTRFPRKLQELRSDWALSLDFGFLGLFQYLSAKSNNTSFKCCFFFSACQQNPTIHPSRVV